MSHPDVALFPSAFHPSLGGVEELTRQLALEQQRRGARPLVVANRIPRSMAPSDTVDGIPVRRVPFHTIEPHWRHLAGYARSAAADRRAVVGLVRSAGASVVHVQGVSTNAVYARHAARRLGLPLVVSLQGELTMDATDVYARSWTLPRTLRRLLREAPVVTACSQATLREAERFCGVELGARGHVVHNGVRLDELRSATPERLDRPYVLAIGRHVPQKGFDLLVRAFAALVREGRTAHRLVVAGDGVEREALIRLAHQLGVAGLVTFPGRCDRARTAALFAGCELFVLPSRHEPMGIVNLEAMAAGRAVLATRVGGVPEVVLDGETGVLVDPGSVEALTAGLRTLLDDAGLRVRLGAAGARRAAGFDWSVVATRYAELYAEALDGAATATPVVA